MRVIARSTLFIHAWAVGRRWKEKPLMLHRRLSDAAVVVVREYSAASGAARHFRRFPGKDASPRHGQTA